MKEDRIVSVFPAIGITKAWNEAIAELTAGGSTRPEVSIAMAIHYRFLRLDGDGLLKRVR